MAENEGTQSEQSATAEAKPAQKPDAAEEIKEPILTETLVERFEKDLEEKGKKAYAKWGFILFHTLDEERVQAERERLGFKPVDALDHYNAGCQLASKDKYAAALKSFALAVQLDSEFFEARFNQALATEKVGDLDEAKKIWNELCKNCEDQEEVTQIKGHLAELVKS